MIGPLVSQLGFSFLLALSLNQLVSVNMVLDFILEFSCTPFENREKLRRLWYNLLYKEKHGIKVVK